MKPVATFLSPDRIAALLFLALVALYGWDASNLTASLQADAIGPTFFPKILTALGLLLGLLLLLRASPRQAAEKAELSDAAQTAASSRGSDLKALAPAGLLLAYVLAFVPLGFPLATALFLLAAFRYFRHPGWLSAALYSLVLTAALFALFRYGLALKLPLGITAKLFS